MPKRRTVLAAGVALAAGGYINHRGLRYPRMGFEPGPLPTSAKIGTSKYTLENAIFRSSSWQVRFRAYAPEPKVKIYLDAQSEFEISNLAESAILNIRADAGITVDEQINQTTRTLSLKGHGEVLLEWYLSEQDGTKFAVIGDTGAGLELEWTLQRAKALGAEFLLHLGDFNYVDGEYLRAIELFNQAPLPVFVAIGNHDFNDSGLVYDQFLADIGPRNHSFEFAGTQFVNIDTAADYLPAYSGQRGNLLREIESANQRVSDRVCFTHRNFLDPRPGQDHVIGGIGERAWLAGQLIDCGMDHLLSGHVHHSAEMEYRGLVQYIVGEGLAYEDIIHEKLVAQLLIGTVEKGQKVKYQWQAMNMPWALHTSPEHEEKLIKEQPASKLEWFKRKMLSEGVTI